MLKSELIEKSPVRELEKSVKGGVGKGNIGVIASKAGIGKTAFLVHIAVDKLMRDRHVIHLSFANRTDHILTWYEDIFKEIAERRSLDNAMDTHDELMRNRVVMNFSQKGVSIEHVFDSLKAMMNQGHFNTDAIIVDGLDFSVTEDDMMKKFKIFAKDTNVELWFSDSYKKEEQYLTSEGIPANLTRFIDDISVILTMKAEKKHMVINLIKDHEKILKEKLALELDPKTLLISQV